MTWNKPWNLLTSFSILRNGNWCEIFPLSFLTLPRLWVKGKTYTEIKQNRRWTAIWHLWLDTSNQKNTWLYFRLWCSGHQHSNNPDFWMLKGNGLYLFSVGTVQSFVSMKVSKWPSAAMETWRALDLHPKDLQWMVNVKKCWTLSWCVWLCGRLLVTTDVLLLITAKEWKILIRFSGLFEASWSLSNWRSGF